MFSARRTPNSAYLNLSEDSIPGGPSDVEPHEEEVESRLDEYSLDQVRMNSYRDVFLDWHVLPEHKVPLY